MDHFTIFNLQNSRHFLMVYITKSVTLTHKRSTHTFCLYTRNKISGYDVYGR